MSIRAILAYPSRPERNRMKLHHWLLLTLSIASTTFLFGNLPHAKAQTTSDNEESVIQIPW
jgi:hypothetical protein